MVEVTDDHGYWSDVRPTCPTTAIDGLLSGGRGTDHGEDGQRIREELAGVEASDQLEVAGYPDFSLWTVFNVVREGVVIGHVRVSTKPGRPLPFTGEVCTDSGIRAKPID